MLFPGTFVTILPSRYTAPDDDAVAHCCGHVDRVVGDDVEMTLLDGREIVIAARRLRVGA